MHAELMVLRFLTTSKIATIRYPDKWLTKRIMMCFNHENQHRIVIGVN